jgi:hypothetical protein
MNAVQANALIPIAAWAIAVWSATAANANDSRCGRDPPDEYRYAMSNGEQFMFAVDAKEVQVILSNSDLLFKGYLCSDQQVVCADVVFGLVAVPRADLSATAAWEARGWRFRVVQSVETNWGSGWLIAGKGPKDAEEFTFVPGAGVVDLRLTESDRPGWKSSTPIRLVCARGVLGGN